MDYKKAKKTYQTVYLIEVIASIFIGFPLSAVLAAILDKSNSASTSFSMILFYWMIAFVVVLLILFSLTYIFSSSFRTALIVFTKARKDGGEIEMIQMVGTNQSFDTSFFSGITYNKTEYTVKITYRDGSSSVRKVSGKWLNQHANLLKI